MNLIIEVLTLRENKFRNFFRQVCIFINQIIVFIMDNLPVSFDAKNFPHRLRF